MDVRARLHAPRSVRARTTALATVVVAVALLVGAVALVLTLEASLARSGDAAARARVHDLAALADAGSLPAVVAAPAEDDVVQVVDARGETLTASPDAPQGGSIARFRPDGASPVVRTLHDVRDGTERESYRVWALRAPTDDGPVFVYVGTSLEHVAETTALLKLLLAVGIPTLLAVLAFVTWVLLGRALAPVEAIRTEVADISGRAPDRRVPVPPTGDEVSRLAQTMNEMLGRLASASRREREFVADASHELQSPLASLRTQLEIALVHPHATDWPALARELLADSDRMERLVRDLLYLARFDATPPPPPATLVDLDVIVLEEARRITGWVRLRVDTTRVSAAPVRGSGEQLRRLVRNLLENAAAHAATWVRLELSESAGQAVLVVSDDGPGVPEGDHERVFERFVRLEAARTPESGGTGLGLAIVRAVAERHDGTAAADPVPSGARFVVRLPSAAQGLPDGSPSGPVPADGGTWSTVSSSSRAAPPETPSARTGPTPLA